MATPQQQELQNAFDEAGSALGKGWAAYEAGLLSRVDLGKLLRREKRAALKLQTYRYANVGA
jgi:hypothetical protein